MSEIFRIHFLVPADDGPLKTEAVGDPVKISTGGRFVCACDPGLRIDGIKERGTGEPWGVRCKACVESELFQQLKRPKPGMRGPESSEQVDNGCC